MNKLIQYPGFLFDRLQPKEAPYHLLLKYLTDYPPEGFEFTETPQEPQGESHAIAAYYDEWRAQCCHYNVVDAFQQVVDRTVPYSGYLPFREDAQRVPADSPCLMSPFPICVPNDTMIEVEDWVTLFHWYFHNGHTVFQPAVKDYAETKVIKAMMDLPNFKCVLTHIKQTIQSLVAIFGDDIAHKFKYAPLGCPPLPDSKVCSRKTLNFIFHGSMNHTALHFGLRGGMYFLEAFRRIEERIPDIQFTIIYDEAPLRSGIPQYYQELISNHAKIKWVRKYQTKEEFCHEMQQADIFVIPAFRTHSMSIGQAMARGLPVITTNGWGIDEYIKDGFNGLVATMPEHTNSWVDTEGIMRENYLPPNQIEEQTVTGIMKHIAWCAENRDLVAAMGVNAKATWDNEITIEKRNKILGQIFEEEFFSD